jgi:hypothetical protein
MVELAWLWRRRQPASALSRWYARRLDVGNKRARKGGIGALARKLWIALWRYPERGELPPGAEGQDWRLRVDATARRHKGGQDRGVKRGRGGKARRSPEERRAWPLGPHGIR